MLLGNNIFGKISPIVTHDFKLKEFKRNQNIFEPFSVS